MTLFLLSIWGIGRQFSDTVDYISRLSLSIHWRFRGLQSLCFHRRFMDQPWHCIFYNSMRQPWLYFCYRFNVSVVISLTLSIRYIDCHSVFIYDFKVYSDSCFAGDLWISCDIAFLTIPCANHDSSFAIDLMRWSWIHRPCRLHTSAVNQFSLTISRSIMIMFSASICGSAMT